MYYVWRNQYPRKASSINKHRMLIASHRTTVAVGNLLKWVIASFL
jgi:hypothetical protein